MSVLAIVVGVLAYPVIAGRVWSMMAPPDNCRGRNRAEGYQVFRCNGPWSVIQQCRACHDRALMCIGAWLWPLLPFVLVPRRLFNAGANVSAMPSPESDTERARRRVGAPDV